MLFVELEFYFGAFAGGTFDLHRSAKAIQPFGDAFQPEMTIRYARSVLWVETDAVILYGKGYAALVDPARNADMPCLAVPDGVDDKFTHDLENRVECRV